MIGSVIVDAVLERVLTGDADVAAAFGDSVHGAEAVPGGKPTPALLYYMAATSQYDGPAGLSADDVAAESLTYHVVALVAGTSYGRILPGVRAQMRALSGQVFAGETDDEGRRYTVVFTARGETPLRYRQPDPGTVYRALGTVYDVDITRED